MLIISTTIGSVVIVFVNIYVKSDIWETRTLYDYLEALSQLDNIVRRMKSDSIYSTGDFSDNPITGTAWVNLTLLMNRNVCKCLGVLDHTFCRKGDGIHVSNPVVL